MRTPAFENPVVWLSVSLLLLAACTYLPLRIKSDSLRNFVMRWVLVPVSIVIIVYVYPVGIEIFRRWAVNFKA
jgi:hypothetical protein